MKERTAFQGLVLGLLAGVVTGVLTGRLATWLAVGVAIGALLAAGGVHRVRARRLPQPKAKVASASQSSGGAQ